MKNRILLIFLFCTASFLQPDMPVCDITHLITREATAQAVNIWALVDLAEQEHVVDVDLFYYELCRASVALYGHVQQLLESGYVFDERQLHGLQACVDHIRDRVQLLPLMRDSENHHVAAADTILAYTSSFLKDDLSIDAHTEADHAGF